MRREQLSTGAGRRARIAVAAIVALGSPAALPNAASAAGEGGLKPCPQPVYANAQTDGTARPIDDNFSKPDSKIWCAENAGSGSMQFGNGLTFHLDPTSLAHQSEYAEDNAELDSITTFKPGEAMSVRIDGTDLKDIQGQRGWGLWNRTLDQSSNEMGWFIYQHSDTLGQPTPSGQAAPDGFFIMTNSRGNYPRFKYLDSNLLKGTHTYSIILTTHSIDYLVDGVSVGLFTDPKAVPTGAGFPLNVEDWVNNGMYLYSFAPVEQFNNTPVAFHTEWLKAGPIGTVPTGPPVVSQPAPANQCSTAQARLRAASLARIRAQKRYAAHRSKWRKRQLAATRASERNVRRLATRACA